MTDMLEPVQKEFINLINNDTGKTVLKCTSYNFDVAIQRGNAASIFGHFSLTYLSYLRICLI